MKRAIWMNERDNVVVLIEAFKKNEVCSYTDARGEEHSFVIKEDIPIYHKAALCEIHRGEHIIKYGECIGIASAAIAQGMHVHVQNACSYEKKEGVEC